MFVAKEKRLPDRQLGGELVQTTPLLVPTDQQLVQFRSRLVSRKRFLHGVSQASETLPGEVHPRLRFDAESQPLPGCRIGRHGRSLAGFLIFDY